MTKFLPALFALGVVGGAFAYSVYRSAKADHEDEENKKIEDEIAALKNSSDDDEDEDGNSSSELPSFDELWKEMDAVSKSTEDTISNTKEKIREMDEILDKYGVDSSDELNAKIFESVAVEPKRYSAHPNPADEATARESAMKHMQEMNEILDSLGVDSSDDAKEKIKEMDEDELNKFKKEFFDKEEPDEAPDEEVEPEKKKPVKGSLVGKTKMMKCGLEATVIEDFGNKDITIQFSDGLVRRHCRRDKFREGSIAHKADA